MKNGLVVTILLLLSACATPLEKSPNLDQIPMPAVWAENKTITLQDGIYSEPAAPGSASTTTVRTSHYFARGTIHDQQVLAIILTTDGGGSGTFFDLFVFTTEHNKLVYADQIPLGDRLKINRVTIANNQISVDLLTRKEGTAMSSGPDRPLTKTFIFSDQKLSIPRTAKQVAQPTPASAIASKPAPPTTLAGKTFYWQSSRYNNDTLATPETPEHYAVTFHPDWSLTIRSDCNTIGGQFTLKGSQLHISPEPPAKNCGETSQSTIFIRDLTDSVNVIFQKNNLYLDIIYDTGTLILTSQL